MKKKRQLQRSDLVWLLAVAMLVLLQFWWLPGDPGTPDDTYSNTIEGKRGFFETLKSLADADMLPTVRRESDRLIPDDVSTLLILSPDRYPNEYEQRELTSFVMNGGTLLMAPNWQNPDFSIPALSMRTKKKYFESQDTVVKLPSVAVTPGSTPGQTPIVIQTPESVETEGESSSSSDPLAELPESAELPEQSNTSESTTTVPVRSEPNDDKNNTKQLIEDTLRTKPGMQPAPVPTLPSEVDDYKDIADLATNSPLVKGAVAWRTRAEMDTARTNPVVLVKTNEGTVQAAIWKYGNGSVLLTASADVFSNRAMLDERQAELAVRLVERLHSEHDAADDTPIVISEFLNASESYRSTGVLMSPSLRSGTLQLLLVGLLVGWFGFHRFGPAKRSTSSERRSLTESATAVGNLFFRTQSGGEAVAGYVDYFKTQLVSLFGSSMRIDDHHRIARRTGLDPDDVRARISNAIARSGAHSTTAPLAATAIRDLSEILNRLTGGRENSK